MFYVMEETRYSLSLRLARLKETRSVKEKLAATFEVPTNLLQVSIHQSRYKEGLWWNQYHLPIDGSIIVTDALPFISIHFGILPIATGFAYGKTGILVDRKTSRSHPIILIDVLFGTTSFQRYFFNPEYMLFEFTSNYCCT